MPKFTISIHGRGSEINVHSITSNQREKLEHLNLDECVLEDIADILELTDSYSLIESDEIYIGAYPENSMITVTTQDGEEEFFSKNIQDLTLSESVSNESSTEEIYQKSKLYVNDYIKGTFFTLDVEDDIFDPKQLELHYTDIEGLELITSFKYKGEESTFGDYWSKGIVYFLSIE